MLRDEPRLQAALVSDQAHVVPGAQGAHVAKIQAVLQLLDRSAAIPIGELRTQRYGTGTAAAVLAYKRRRAIVNTSYQATADNIVGKMTIARMDAEILAIELRGNPERSVCSGANDPIVSTPDGAGVSSLVASSVTAPGRKPAPRPPVLTFRIARLAVVFQITDGGVEVGGGVSLLLGQFQKARELLVPLGLDFGGAAGGVFPLIGPQIPDSDKKVLSGSEASCVSIRMGAERVFPNQPDVLRVIFCPFDDVEGEAFGVTDGGGTTGVPKFCLINVRKANRDQGTVLHEMIHAAGFSFAQHDNQNPTSVFSENIGGRSVLRDVHANGLAGSFFGTILA